MPKIFRDDFFTRMGPSMPEIFRGDVSPKWDYLCPKRKILPKKQLILWRGYFATLLLLSPVSHLFAFAYIHFSVDLFFFACLSVFTQVGPSVPKIFRDDFLPNWVHPCRRYLTVIFSGVVFSPKCECALLYLGPTVPEILIGVIFYTQ